MVKGKYINEKARTAYKEAEKKSNIPNVKVGLDEIINSITTVETKLVDDMLKMMDKIDKLEQAARILANRLNRVDGMGK